MSAAPSLVIAVSSRVLFDAEAAHAVFAEAGSQAFLENEAARSRDILEPGLGFELVRRATEWGDREGVDVRVAVVSRRDPETGARILRSLAHHGLTKVQGSFANGVENIVPYIQAYGAHVFLSRDAKDVQAAVDAGIPAAEMTGVPAVAGEKGLRIAFDGDAVLFSDESERFYLEHGLEKFLERESTQVDVPLPDGPMVPFLRAIHQVQDQASEKLFRIALITARQGLASERAIRTLAAWGLGVDEAHFAGTTPKIGLLKAFRPHLFLDDSLRHLQPASGILPAGRVPWPTKPEDVTEGQVPGP